jgi:PPOX class probable F420-dependent enzyme
VQKMTSAEAKSFLMQGTRTAKLATVRADGRPHVVPVWFVVDGDDLIFTTWYTTVNAANLLNEARVCLCVDDEQPPFAFIQMEGVADIQEQAADLLDWTTRIARRYMGDALADAFGKRNAVPGEWLVRVRPVKILAIKGMAD